MADIHSYRPPANIKGEKKVSAVPISIASKGGNLGTASAFYPFKSPDWKPPFLEDCHPFYLPPPWDCWMTVVPRVTTEMADAWLALNVKNNRNKIESLVNQVFQDAVKGTFLPTHQGIAFNRQNLLFDGQNRLTGAKRAGVPIPLLVFWGVDDGTMLVTDTGRSRSNAAAARIMGEDFGSQEVAVARRAIQHISYSPPVLSRTEMFDFVRDHSAGIDFAIRVVTGHKELRKAAVKAAFFRAYYHISLETLERVGRVLTSGMPEADEDSTVIHLRNRIIGEVESRGRTGSSQISMDHYFKVLRTIRAVSVAEKLDKIIFPENLDRYEDVYQIPATEAEWIAAGSVRPHGAAHWPEAPSRSRAWKG